MKVYKAETLNSVLFKLRKKYPQYTHEELEEMVSLQFRFVYESIKRKGTKPIYLKGLGIFAYNFTKGMKNSILALFGLESNPITQFLKDNNIKTTDVMSFIKDPKAWGEFTTGYLHYKQRIEWIEELHRERFAICSECPIMTVQNNATDPAWKYRCDMAKGGCNCSIPIKTRTPGSKCPFNKWLELTEEDIIERINRHKTDVEPTESDKGDIHPRGEV